MKLTSFCLLLAFALVFGGLTSCADGQVQESTAEATTDGNENITPEEAKAVQTSMTESDYDDGLQLGEKAPDFTLKGVDGKTFTLSEYKLADGSKPKGYVVTFTCNTCPYAKAYEDRLIELHNDLAPKGYPVIAVQPNDPAVQPGDSFEAMKERSKSKKFPFVYLLDEGQKVYPLYGATRTPEIFLLDADMTLRYHGAIDDSAQDPSGVSVNYVKSAVTAIENGKQPDPADVKAIGCSIKAKRT